MLSRFVPLLLAVTSVVAKVSYDGAKAIRIPMGEDVMPVMNIIKQLQLPTWKGVQEGVPKAGGTVDLVVPADKVTEFNQLMTGINHEVLHDDLGASIEAEGKTKPYKKGVVDITWYNSYHPYTDHLQYLNDLQAKHPANSEIVVAGNSGQGQPITGIHFYGKAGKGKPAVVIHGTVHAREWITTLTVEYLAYNLLSNYSSNPEITSYIDKYDFFIFPVVNPDGKYKLPHYLAFANLKQDLHTPKARTGSGVKIVKVYHQAPVSVVTSTENWPFQWDHPGGSSTNPCDETYRGNSLAW
ncbi:hypothetical protein G7Y89_g11771 [Cudoniella acicularis]|uniref:Peptidase M14 domain-containing protein n=1 Tax=Cudoniella acicularis TaxID=354080 RepID=A0A8H4RBR1_9HELO|nr:hypothetical protein G7Y89_g11771 [Cudoniella acicularis]